MAVDRIERIQQLPRWWGRRHSLSSSFRRRRKLHFAARKPNYGDIGFELHESDRRREHAVLPRGVGEQRVADLLDQFLRRRYECDVARHERSIYRRKKVS